MSQKVKKQQQHQQPTTTIEAVPSPSSTRPATPSRPVSPARMSRIQEKNELQNLNDRLAAYIDRVRQLESENSKLKVQVQKSIESREIHSVKQMYENEMRDTRASLDSIAKQRAQLELEISTLREDLKSAENKLNKKIVENSNLEKRLHSIENQMEDLKAKLNQANGDRKRLENELKSVQEDAKVHEDQMKGLRKQLEQETIMRVDLENRNQSLNEELQFQRQLFQKELEEVKVKEYHLKETFTEDLKVQYEQRMADEINSLRAEHDERLQNYRQDLEDKYETQIGVMQDEIDRKGADLSSAHTKIKQLNSTYTFMNSELDNLKMENQSMKDKISDLNKLLEQERDWNKKTLDRKDRELADLRAKLETLLEEHKDLLDDKIKLDNELSVYRTLLEGEENRLNLSPRAMTPLPVGTTTPRPYVQRGNKRKRTCLLEEENLVDIAVNSTAKGDIEISEHDQEGKFVKVFNKGDKDVSLSGWQLVRTADNLETRFKFHRSIVLKPGNTCTVWSSDTTAFHAPPTDIVMKAQTWFTADTMTTTLWNNNNEEVATRKTEKRVTSQSQRQTFGYLNDNENEVDGQKCTIM